MTGIPGSDSIRLVLGLEEPWQSRAHDGCSLDLANNVCVERYICYKPYVVQKSPYPLSGGVLIFRGSPDRDLGSRRSTESTLEAELENNNGITSSNMIRLDSSESRENSEAKDLGDLVGQQWYIMDKPLPQTLLDGSSSEERETFERWHADHRKVRSIILASMSNDVQKQYDRLEDVASILQRMKEVYAIPDRHTSGKARGPKSWAYNDTYIDVILQSLPPSYDPFIVNFNMNGLGKSINELINMLVKYEATIKKSAPSVLIGEASTSKAKGKRAGRWKRKKGKAKAKTVVVAKRR
ncbi:UNVERIFIED_CONTAM: hypothetical protein Scaly_3139100 [Sesamum calycinum]|uniref:Uncharacterized protein n=1 Tax=Sesamum calycinum TaxID=2727403 RepID=A0AAW2JGY2_9LAMI